MSSTDIPDPNMPPRQVDVATLVDGLLKDLRSVGSSDILSESGAIIDHGQINHMTLPQRWRLGPIEHRDIGTYSFCQCSPPDEPDVAICFLYRGLPISTQVAKDFRSILDKPPHVLDQVEKEKCSDLLRDRADPNDFTMRKCATMNLNGLCVLVIEGTFIEKQEDVSEVFVDADGSGRFVQEIFYQAPNGKGSNPVNLYGKYLPLAQDSFKSIIWKLQPPKD